MSDINTLHEHMLATKNVIYVLMGVFLAAMACFIPFLLGRKPGIGDDVKPAHGEGGH